MNPSAILFDLDGVLVDACEWHYLSLNRALKSVLGTEITRQDHVTTYNGLPTKVKLDMLGMSGKDAERIWGLKQDLTVETIKQNSKILEEKIELHSFLKKEGIKIACVTNSINKTAHLMLKSTGQLDFMDLIVTNEDVKNNKPYPDCYNFAVRELEVDPNLVVIVEDSPKGIQSALASSVKNLWKVLDSSEVTLENYRRFVNENLDTNGR